MTIECLPQSPVLLCGLGWEANEPDPDADVHGVEQGTYSTHGDNLFSELGALMYLRG